MISFRKQKCGENSRSVGATSQPFTAPSASRDLLVMRVGENEDDFQTLAQASTGLEFKPRVDRPLLQSRRLGFQSVKIVVDELEDPAIHALLNEHLQNMYQLSPAESVHALNVEKLQAPDITFWTAWEDNLLLGCGALKELTPTHGEIKSVRTPLAHRRRGAGRAILRHIIEVAKGRAYERLSLETGTAEAFNPARSLYESFGFSYCGPFWDYIEDPNSVFMTLLLKHDPPIFPTRESNSDRG